MNEHARSWTGPRHALSAATVPAAPAPLYRFADDPDDVQVIPTLDLVVPTLPSATPAQSIEDITHANRLALQAEMTQGKGTELAYPRQVDAYVNYMVINSPGVVAFPITAAKVALYLEYATKRCKVYSSTLSA